MGKFRNKMPPMPGGKPQPRRLISSAEAVKVKGQHEKPCSDCPMTRSSLPGWLGGAHPHQYRALAHSDMQVDCHTLLGAQCAGMAIYRTNVVKRCDPPNLVLPGDTRLVFATPKEFMDHHLGREFGCPSISGVSLD